MSDSKGFLFLDAEDDVLDVINDFPEEMRKNCLKFISEHEDKSSSFMFALEGRGYGMIMKFPSTHADGGGLVMMGADEPEVITEKLELLRDSLTDERERRDVEERLNAARYSFAMIKQQATAEQLKRLGQ